MFDHVLVPYDGSPLAEQSVPLACTLAHDTTIHLRLLRSTAGMWLPALPAAPDFAGYYGPFDWLLDPETMQKIREVAAGSLDTLVKTYPAPGIHGKPQSPMKIPLAHY